MKKLQPIDSNNTMAERQSRLAGRDKFGRFEELSKAKEKKSSTVEHLPLPGYGDTEK